MKPVTLITGASQGIGAATARLLAAQGHSLLIHYAHQADLAREVVQSCLQLGSPHAIIAQADLSDEEQVLKLFTIADKSLPPLTGLVNNAGIVDQTSPLADMSAARMQRMLAVNVLGPMLCAREAVKRMSTRLGGQGGVIVNVSSSAVRTGSPNLYVDYAASKGAIDVLTNGLSKEVAPEGVRVVAVRPGITDTGIHATGGEPDRAARLGPTLPMGRAASPGEVAQAIVWLLSDKASYTAGAILDVTGGR
ncbi:MAG: SDR family oxidoreductase [Aquabacterium sp.]|uniref:SDR family oxidoreductase n=1 Tax=Aquabacterium sp. TaxID=1872578 RepID=UPI0025BB955D|nr:SDR family oxidoreductase [Aquabacterium sp.]MBI5927080.1 SDR family oxidoreductase [Aquabacterium sp.]